MGHSINPIGIRLGYNKSWTNTWNSYNIKNYSYLLTDDILFSKYFVWFVQNQFLENLGIIISHYKIFRHKNIFKVVLFIYDGKSDTIVNEFSELHQQIDGSSENKNLIKLYWEQFFWKNLQKKNWDTVISIFEKHLKVLFPNLKIEIYVQKINSDNLPAIVIGKYIVKQLSQRIGLMDVISPVIRNLKSNDNLIGFRINCSGRFTRRQMASYIWWKEGRLNMNTLSIPLDYASLNFRLRYGICGLKIWLYLKDNIPANIYLYKYNK